VRFHLKGVASLFGIQQLVHADIQNQRMSFSVQGYPFNGIYKMKLMVTAVLSNGNIADNLASVFGVFEMQSNVRQIEQSLDDGIQQWVATGLEYVQVW
jgi:hypothetical protein